MNKARKMLNAELERVVEDLQKRDLDSAEYRRMLKDAETLESLANGRVAARKPLSADAVLTVVGSLAGIALILWVEDEHVLSTKSLGFVLRPRA